MADAVGVAATQLRAGDSLAQDLAVRWLDLLELALRIEEALDVSLPDALLGGVQTYGELEALVLDRRRHPAGTAAPPLLARLRVQPPRGGAGVLSRVLVLTPYGLETIAADARRTGRGTLVHVEVPAGTRDPELAALRAALADLASAAISVRVDRDPQWRA